MAALKKTKKPVKKTAAKPAKKAGVKTVKYRIGQKVAHSFCPPSKVVGIDSYTLKAFDGKVRRWTSYTLTSDRKGVFARWWIVNVPLHGAHYFVAGKGIPKNVAFDAL